MITPCYTVVKVAAHVSVGQVLETLYGFGVDLLLVQFAYLSQLSPRDIAHRPEIEIGTVGPPE